MCVDWLRAERERQGLSRKELARRVWPNSAESVTTAQIKRYETVERDGVGRPINEVTLPAPDTLRKICAELGIPWTVGFVNAGYYRQILELLVGLVELGFSWINEDGGFPDESAERSFRSMGITRIGGKVVWDALLEPHYGARYIQGEIVEPPLPTEPEFDENIPLEVRQRFEADSRETKSWAYVVPKPMALALLIVAAGFPRRGDVWKNGVNVYAAHLLEASMPLIERAESVRTKKLSGHILRADRSLQDTSLSLDSRRLVAAEHLIAWADDVCQGYTHYARLASMYLFGVAGSTEEAMTPEAWLPHIRQAKLPDVDSFRTAD
jgi:transcriptional regulator with XRE-family HTH domain